MYRERKETLLALLLDHDSKDIQLLNNVESILLEGLTLKCLHNVVAIDFY